MMSAACRNYENRNNEATKLLNKRMKALGAFTEDVISYFLRRQLPADGQMD